MTKQETNMLLTIAGGGLLLALAGVFNAVKGSMDRKTFLITIKPIAERIKNEYGIQPVITITQSALESSWGKSGLTQKANNLFGVKKSASWTGNIIIMPTSEYDPKLKKNITVQAQFKAYPSWYESIKDWAQLIKTSYKEAYGYAKSGDLPRYAGALRRGTYGAYATDPNYEDKIRVFAKAVQKEVTV